MSRATQISSIIAQRQPLAEKVEVAMRNLSSLSSELHKLEDYRNCLLERVDDRSITGHLREIDFSNAQQNIVSELEALSKLKARFSRNTLNIGVIGRARQGKSRLLQSLTGLTKAEIPDGSGQHCTGVRSTIHHNADIETYGEVFFYTERSFLDEVISPYYEELKLGIKPTTLDGFASKDLPQLPNNAGAEAGAKYEHLRKYYRNLDKYRPLLRESSPRRIRKEEIREYVAQDNLQGERIYFNYLAVREVKIVCSFPKEDVGQIALVDLPGLGDTGIGDEKRMVQSIGQDIDAVLFVRMPKPTGDYWAEVDVQLYDTAHRALNDLPLQLWSFMVLNKLGDASNSKLCEDLKQDIAEKHISVVNCIIANCADEVEANSKVLDLVLAYLTDKIVWLDQQYASSCQERLNQLQSVVSVELDKAKNALGSAKQSDEFEKFSRLFDAVWGDMTYGIDTLLKDLREQISQRDKDFEKSIEEVIQKCREDTKIPTSLEEIKRRSSAEGSVENAYNMYLNEVRANLSQHFLSLDDGLRNSLDRLKNQVVEVLLKEGLLAGLTQERGVGFLKAIVEQLEELDDQGQPSQLRFGFQVLSEFELSYRGMVQHRIRKHLDNLTPDKTYLKISTSSSKTEPAQQIMSSLQVLHRETVFQCKTALEELLCEPSQAKFAIVEEFCDRVLRAKDVQNEWKFFLQRERSSIWPAEFELLGERSKLRQEWLKQVESAATTNQFNSLQLLK